MDLPSTPTVGGSFLLSPHDEPSVVPSRPQAESGPRPLKLEYKGVTSQFEIIREAVRAKRLRDREQLKLIRDTDIWHATIESKLQGFLNTTQFWNFCRCGKEQIYRTCRECSDQKVFTYSCSLKWCPRCNWKITRKRQELIKHWIAEIQQPKHLVTTSRNSSTLTSRMIRQHTKALTQLRRSTVFDQVKGGCVAVEITNEGRGWHMHAHWLVDARWVDQKQLAIRWGELVGQDFAIVKVMDLRSRSEYQREVAKYVCKGSEMARWEPEEINEFVRAVKGKRFFFAFGNLFKSGAKIRAQISAERPECGCSECGSNKFLFRTELEQVIHDHNAGTRRH